MAKELNIPAGTKEVEDEAYKGDSSFTRVVIPAGVKTLGSNAFEDCTALEEVVLPEGLTGIGWETFKGCTALRQVIIPESCVEIEDQKGIFSGCTALERVEFKGAIHGIGMDFLKDCIALKNVVFSTGLGLDRYKGHVWNCYAFSGCKSLEMDEMPEGVTELQSWVFEGCSFDEVVIPSTVKNIYENAFLNCVNLAFVTHPAEAWIGRGAFKGCSKKLKKIKK